MDYAIYGDRTQTELRVTLTVVRRDARLNKPRGHHCGGAEQPELAMDEHRAFRLMGADEFQRLAHCSSGGWNHVQKRNIAKHGALAECRRRVSLRPQIEHRERSIGDECGSLRRSVAAAEQDAGRDLARWRAFQVAMLERPPEQHPRQQAPLRSRSECPIFPPEKPSIPPRVGERDDSKCDRKPAEKQPPAAFG